MNEMPRVAVLLSTYNGEEYLQQQLESLLAQEQVQVDLYVRDDGSTDRTLEIVRSYSRYWPWLASLESGPNLRAGPSFLSLLGSAPSSYLYYAFCDQDDVWFPGKLARAVQQTNDAAPGPLLYCSQFTCADGDLEPVGPGPGDSDGRFQHQLFENIAWGCTIVLNSAARELITERLPSNPRIMHDWWCATAISALGQVVYDPEPTLLYRQHGRNAIGLQSSRMAQIWEQARLFLKNPGSFYSMHPQAAELLAIFGDRMRPEHLRLLQRVVKSKRSFAARLSYFLTGPINRRRLADALVARALVLGGWY